MYRILKYYIFRPFFIWLSIFALFKMAFLFFHWDLISSENIFSILKIFTKSLKLDISAVSYILLIPFLLSLIQYFYNSKKIKVLLKYYFIFIIFLVSFLNISDIILYDYWSSRLSLKSFLFINTPASIIASLGTKNTLMVFIFLFFHIAIAMKIFEPFFKSTLCFTKSFFAFIFFTILTLTLLIIGLRGGLQVVPINQSIAYYSSNNTLNTAGINPLWNFFNILFQNRFYSNSNPYKKMQNEEAKLLVENLLTSNTDSILFVLNNKKPNIVYIVMEGVNANVFKSFNHKESYAPNIEKLFSEGYLFKEMYAAGFRSDQGMVSILSGFPPTPVSSICAQVEKFSKLPSFTKEIENKGYHSSFYFGGEASFGNFKSYLVYNGFEPLIEVDNYPKEQRTQNLGVPDEFVFNKFAKEMVAEKEPFFSMIFTQTTHEPYDMPFNNNIKDERLKYLNTVSYLDSEIGIWYNKMKTMPWYDNTIFVLMSDHAHYHPGNYDNWVNERFHIPFLIFGKPLKTEFKGKVNNKICSQVDIPKSILSQLEIKSKDFKWSKNIFNPKVNEFAFYTFVEAAVLKTKNNTCGYEYNWDKSLGNCDTLIYQKQSQAFLQILYDDYLSY